jgi:hypothetical protein
LLPILPIVKLVLVYHEFEGRRVARNRCWARVDWFRIWYALSSIEFDDRLLQSFDNKILNPSSSDHRLVCHTCADRHP